MSINPFDLFLVKRAARTDARHGQNSVDERITGAQGLQPKLDPKNNLEDGELVRAYNDRTRIDELREDLNRIRDALSGRVPMFGLIVGLVVAVAIESLSGIWILQAMGTEPRSRWLFGIGLAVTLIGITAIAAHATTPPSNGNGNDGGQHPVPKRFRWTIIIYFIYSVFILAIMVVRVENSIDDDISTVGIVAQSIIMLGLSVGPAWLAEYVIRRFAESKTIRDRLANVRRELRDAERAFRRAKAAVIRISRRSRQWEDEAARRRALYATQHRLETAKEKS